MVGDVYFMHQLCFSQMFSQPFLQVLSTQRKNLTGSLCQIRMQIVKQRYMQETGQRQED